jgi:hypothetical protein
LSGNGRHRARGSITAEPYSRDRGLKLGDREADSARMQLATDAVELRRLRTRLDNLVLRRTAAEERLVHVPDSASREQLDMMRVELTELEWHLGILESMARN